MGFSAARFSGNRLGTLVLVAVAVALPCMTGCLTPLVVSDRHAAVGLFDYEHERIGPGIEYDRVRGVGVGVISGSFVVGYSRQEMVAVDRADRSFHIRTDWAEMLGGEAAEGSGPLLVAAPPPGSPP
jgi:hypothetical protein